MHPGRAVNPREESRRPLCSEVTVTKSCHTKGQGSTTPLVAELCTSSTVPGAAARSLSARQHRRPSKTVDDPPAFRRIHGVYTSDNLRRFAATLNGEQD